MSTLKLVCLLIATTSIRAIAQMGCMDNSYHMKQTADNKAYHYVQCNCDCKHHQQSSDRGMCSKCGHYRDPGTFEIVRIQKTESKSRG